MLVSGPVRKATADWRWRSSPSPVVTTAPPDRVDMAWAAPNAMVVRSRGATTWFSQA